MLAWVFAAGKGKSKLAWVLAMAYTTNQVVSLLDSSFQGEDSSDDDLGMDIEGMENTFSLEQSMQTQGMLYSVL